MLFSKFKMIKPLSAFALTLGLLASASASNPVERGLDEWLDSDLQPKKSAALQVLQSLTTGKIPQQFETQEYGYSCQPMTHFDWMYLKLIKDRKAEQKGRPMVVDLGCGLGHMPILAMLAGAQVDAVDYKDTVTEANKNIFVKTKSILGYDGKTSRQFYRAHPCDLKAAGQQSWMTEKHEFALSKDVLHFFTENEIRQFAAKLFENLIEDGAAFIQVDTPTMSDTSFEFYKKNRGKVACPGLAVYNKKMGGGGTAFIGEPVLLDEQLHKIKIGQSYRGKFLKDGKIVQQPQVYHNVRNLFLKEELAALFEQAGFDTIESFYLSDVGDMLTGDELPEIGTISKACLMLVKPIKQIPVDEELMDQELAKMLLQQLFNNEELN